MMQMQEIEKLLEQALAEDIRSGDLTTQSLLPSTAVLAGRLTLKQAGVIAGLPFLESLFHKLDPKIIIDLQVKEGAYLKAGTIIAHITGPASGILTGERVALNLLQHASGVATITSTYVKKVAGLNCAIMDTRKTLPCLRALEKYAVKVGGGVNHRFGLDDRLVIKANHLPFFPNETTNEILEAVNKLKSERPNLPIEIEIDDINMVELAIQTDVYAIMLSNMTPDEIGKCVKKAKGKNKKIYVESVGAITLDTVRAYAETGVDGISIGDLTHSVQALDIRLRLL